MMAAYIPTLYVQYTKLKYEISHVMWKMGTVNNLSCSYYINSIGFSFILVKYSIKYQILHREACRVHPVPTLHFFYRRKCKIWSSVSVETDTSLAQEGLMVQHLHIYNNNVCQPIT